MSQSSSFMACWVNNLNQGLPWVQLVGTFLIGYQYSLTAQDTMLWKVLLAHGCAGFLGSFLETAFLGHQDAQLEGNISWLLGVNEINWIIHESSTVLYSWIKFDHVIESELAKKILRNFMGFLFLVFAGLRIHIGALRVMDNTVMNEEIAKAHSWAFLAWGCADLLLFALLLLNIFEHFTESSRSMIIIKAMMQSSLPRIFVIILNTFMIVIVGQIDPVNLTSELQVLNTVLWMIKGTYPLILLLDLKNTKDLIIQQKRESQKQAAAAAAAAQPPELASGVHQAAGPPGLASTTIALNGKTKGGVRGGKYNAAPIQAVSIRDVDNSDNQTLTRVQ